MSFNGFPSKNLEYLSSGTPFVAYKLDGIPDEYDGYINYIKDNSLESLANQIQECAESMADYLKIRDKKWMLMEGSIHTDDIVRIESSIKSKQPSNCNKVVIMYSGMIEKRYGLDYFLDAIKMLDVSV